MLPVIFRLACFNIDSMCDAETADGEPEEEAGCAEGSSERTARRHQSQRPAGGGGGNPVISLFS